jgi:hypothetical protein
MSDILKKIYLLQLVDIQSNPKPIYANFTSIAATNICYLIDETQVNRATEHNIEEKIQLARNISRCLRSKDGDTNIATVIYDNNSAKLGFNFKSVDDILNDGFQQMIVNQRQRRNTQGMLYFMNHSQFFQSSS